MGNSISMLELAIAVNAMIEQANFHKGLPALLDRHGVSEKDFFNHVFQDDGAFASAMALANSCMVHVDMDNSQTSDQIIKVLASEIINVMHFGNRLPGPAEMHEVVLRELMILNEENIDVEFSDRGYIRSGSAGVSTGSHPSTGGPSSADAPS